MNNLNRQPYISGLLVFIGFILSFAALHTSYARAGEKGQVIKGTAMTVAKPEIDAQSGLVKAEGFNLVLAHCSACHSSSLITQNAMSRERWLDTIRWMQETQKLWALGEAEPVILDYLSTWYGPKKSARRPQLSPHLLPKQ